VLAAVERGIAGHDLGPLVEAGIAGALAARATQAADLDGIERETLRSLRAYERAGDPRNAATQLTVLGMAAVRGGRYREGEGWLDTALALVRKMRLPAGIGMTLRPLALVYLRRGEGERALEAIREAVTWLGTTEHDRLKHVAQVELANAHFELGDLTGADAQARALLGSAAPAPFLRQFALAIRSRVALREGRVDDALELAREAVAVPLHDRALIDSEAVAELAWIEALLAHGDTDAARDAAGAATARIQVIGSGYESPERRRAFFADVPVHAAIFELAQRLSP
jgi:tetratricopeptide (TPR) repeat protein